MNLDEQIRTEMAGYLENLKSLRLTTPDAPQQPETPALADWLALQRILYERALRAGDEARAAFYKKTGMIERADDETTQESDD